jgi:tetratricopeptide (TPR) repeat protein
MKKIILFLGIVYSLNLHSQNAIRDLELKILNSQFDSAIIVANQIIKNDSVNWQAYFYLGKSYQAKYKYFDALDAFELALKLDSGNMIIENTLAATYDAIGKDEEAINIYYDQYLRDTTEIDPIVNLANIFRKMREYGSAVFYYRKASEIDPQNFYYYKQQGYCISKMNMPVTPAIYAYEAAIKLNPYDVGMYHQLSNLYNSERYFADAIKVSDRGLLNFKDDKQLLKIKAYAYYLNKDFDSSIVIFNKLLELGDSSFFNFKYKGFVYFEKMQFVNSINELEKAFELDRNDAEVCFYLGSALGRSGNGKDGIYYLNESKILLSPLPKDLYNIHTEMANIYLNQGEYDLSLKYLKLAYKNRAIPILSFKMGQLYDYYLDDKKMAIDCYEAYITSVNIPDSAELEQGDSDKAFFADIKVLENSEERIRTLKEELFFEEAKKE